MHTLVGSLLGLAVVRSSLDEIEDLLREGRVGDGPSCHSAVSCLRRSRRCRRENIPACSLDMMMDLVFGEM